MKTKLILFLFVLQAFIFNLANVITPVYIKNLGIPNYMFGYFFALWSLGMLVSSPIWGSLGDKYGRKKFIIIGLMIYGFSQLMFAFITNIPLLIIFRFLSGIGVGAPVTLLLTHLINIVKPNERGKYLSYRMAFITLGGTISYKISGYLGLIYTEELFYFQALLTILFILSIHLFMKEDKEIICNLYNKQTALQGLKKMNHISKSLTLFLLSITLTTMTFINIDRYLDVYIIDLGYSSNHLGTFKMVVGLVGLFTNFLIVPKCKKYLGDIATLQSIQVLSSVILIVVFWGNNVILMLYTVFMSYIVLRALFTTSEQTYLSCQASNEQCGLMMGVRQSFACIGMIVGPIIGGYVYSVKPHYLFLFSSFCLLLSSILLSQIKTNTSNKSKTPKLQKAYFNKKHLAKS